MLLVEDEDPFVQRVHSVLMYETNRRTNDPYSGKYLVAM